MNTTSDYLSESSVSIKEAWKKINVNKRHILYIVDSQGGLKGSVCDGDVRRWILADKDINDSVELIMNKQPIVARETDSPETLKNLMIKRHRIESVPIVGSKGKIDRIVFLHELLAADEAQIHRSDMNVPVVIMAGGSGTRLAPFTYVLPKPLMPIEEKPIIDIIMERFRKYSTGKIYVSINYKANLIRAYLLDSGLASDIEFLEEEKPLGTIGALYQLKTAEHPTYFITNCDILIDADYKNIHDFHESENNDMTIVCSMKNFKIPYGVVKIDKNGILDKIIEKPDYDNLISTGMYVMSRSVIELIPENTHFDITTLIDNAKNNNKRIGIYPIDEKAWLDIGQMNEYKRTIETFHAL